MKISIITSTYNSADTLRDTLESVLVQTHGDVEFIIVDGGSTDGTLDILKEYEDRLGNHLRWVSEKDEGLYDAMNKGLRMATGEVAGILNSDDLFFDETCLARIAEAFEDPNVDCVFGDLQFVRHNNINHVVRLWKGEPYTPGAFLKGWHPAHPTFYTRTKFYREFGDFDLDIYISADFELMLRFIEIHRLRSKYINHYLVKMRMGGVSTRSLRNIIRGNQNVLRSFKKHGLKVSPFYVPKRWTKKTWDVVKSKIIIRLKCKY